MKNYFHLNRPVFTILTIFCGIELFITWLLANVFVDERLHPAGMGFGVAAAFVMLMFFLVMTQLVLNIFTFINSGEVVKTAKHAHAKKLSFWKIALVNFLLVNSIPLILVPAFFAFLDPQDWNEMTNKIYSDYQFNTKSKNVKLLKTEIIAPDSAEARRRGTLVNEYAIDITYRVTNNTDITYKYKLDDFEVGYVYAKNDGVYPYYARVCQMSLVGQYLKPISKLTKG
jgi:hypothetical protein